MSLNNNWTWHNEIDNRKFFENNKQQQFIAHSRVHYKFMSNADWAIGFTYSLQYPQDPNSVFILKIPEIRPNQEVNYSNNFSKRFSVQHRIRLDERFFHKNDGKILLNGYDFNFRIRYRLLATLSLNKENAKNQSTLKIADELMINAGKRIVYNQFDQNRVYVAVEQSFNKNFSAELGYMKNFQQRSSGTQFFDRNIIRFTIFHKIKL